MTDFKTTEVYSHLRKLMRYLKGDLETFHKISLDIEAEEQNALLLRLSTPITSSLASSPVTTETTRSPNSYQSNIDEYFRMTIPHTLALFSAIDFIGYLSGSNQKMSSTLKNFKEFFNQSSVPVSEDEIELLSQVYRNGLGHIYFPKLNLGISYHSSNPAGKLFFKDFSGIVLNVNQLERLVLATSDEIINKASLFPEMERKFQLMINEYKSKHQDLINRIAT